MGTGKRPEGGTVTGEEMTDESGEDVEKEEGRDEEEREERVGWHGQGEEMRVSKGMGI